MRLIFSFFFRLGRAGLALQGICFNCPAQNVFPFLRSPDCFGLVFTRVYVCGCCVDCIISMGGSELSELDLVFLRFSFQFLMVPQFLVSLVRSNFHIRWLSCSAITMVSSLVDSEPVSRRDVAVLYHYFYITHLRTS